MQFLFLTALKAEARPLITRLKLQKDSKSQLYKKDNTFLFITGVGKKKCQDRLQSLKNMDLDWENIVLINLGIAGGNANRTAIGSLYRVNKIIDEKTGRSYFPDILIHNGLNEIQLTTVKNGVSKNGNRYSGLVDMEASAIFETMSKYVPTHRLLFLKVVSDHMDVTDWKFLDVESLILGKLDLIQLIVKSHNNIDLSDRYILTAAEIKFLNQGSIKLQFTKTQSLQLISRAEKFKKLGKEINKLESFFTMTPRSKQERNKIFDQIKQSLST